MLLTTFRPRSRQPARPPDRPRTRPPAGQPRREIFAASRWHCRCRSFGDRDNDPMPHHQRQRAGASPPAGLPVLAFAEQHQCIDMNTDPTASMTVTLVSLKNDAQTTAYPAGGATPFTLFSLKQPAVGQIRTHRRQGSRRSAGSIHQCRNVLGWPFRSPPGTTRYGIAVSQPPPETPAN